MKNVQKCFDDKTNNYMTLKEKYIAFLAKLMKSVYTEQGA
jgi:hypothetical protein